MNNLYKILAFIPLFLFIDSIYPQDTLFTREIAVADFIFDISNVDSNFLNKFNSEVTADSITIKKDDISLSGFSTNNRKFYSEVLKPILLNKIDTLRSMIKTDMINELTIFSYYMYQKFFGKSFYRWGGDIFDLDDPQNAGIRHRYLYGLDCSGFSALPYEIAVDLALLSPEEAAFSSKGFEYYSKINGLEDKGGRENTGNNYRPDTDELAVLGREILIVEESEKIDPEYIKMIKPGDIIGRPGHFGIVIKLDGELYYLESGGWVVPPSGGNPYLLEPAVNIFAGNGYLTIRRCLIE